MNEWTSDTVPPDGTITGQVTTGQRPVAEATVMIIEGERSHPDMAALTDETGAFTLGGLSPGRYRLEVRHDERVVRRGVDVSAGECLWLDVLLPE